MSLISKIAGWDRKFAWSFFGFVLAVFFGGLTIYNEFIKNPNPALSVHILSDTNVLDVRENVPELKIIYGDVDIKNLNQTLSVLVFRVQNSGGAPILNAYYDENVSPSLALTVGRFVKVEQVAATSDYLRTSAQTVQTNQSTLQLPRVIMEPGEGYTVKALVLHGPRNGLPLKASGKIAGAKDIPVLPLEAEQAAASLWTSAFSGAVTIQLVRAPAYFFGFTFLLVSTFGSAAFVSDRIEGASRRRVANQFRRHNKGELSASEVTVLDAYQERGLRPLVRVKELLGNEERLKRALELLRKMKADSPSPFLRAQGIDTERVVEMHASSRGIIDAEGGVPIDVLEKLEIAALLEDGTCEVNKPLELFLSRFIDYVNIKKS